MGGTRRGGPDVNIKHSGREDNDRERERYRMERERDDYRREFRDNRRENRRSRSPKIRERPRSRSRERKERKRRRSEDEYERRDSRRDREREKERKRNKRSKSRERKRDKRDKSREKRDKERKERKPEYGDIKIKEEPVDDGTFSFLFRQLNFFFFFFIINLYLCKYYQGNLIKIVVNCFVTLANINNNLLIICLQRLRFQGLKFIQIKLIGSINLVQSSENYLKFNKCHVS